MNFFKRALISIRRNLGKTSILLCLIFILGNVISGAISVRQAVQNTEGNLRSKLPAVATIEMDYRAMEKEEESTGESPEVENLTPELMKKIGELPYVKDYDYSAFTALYSKEFQLYEGPEDEDDSVVYSSSSGIKGLEYMTLKGVQDPEILDLKEGNIQLSSGRVFTDEEVNTLSYKALVSKNFSETNKLSVGSTFSLENIVFNEDAWEKMYDSDFNLDENIFASQAYDFEVIGIFEPATQASTGDKWLDKELDNQVENRIYIPNSAAEASQRFAAEQYAKIDEVYNPEEDDYVYYDNIYTLNDPLELDEFKEAVISIMPEFYTVSDMSNTYSSLTSSMESMQSLSSIVLWVAVGATLLIISLLIILFLRDRKYEIGIYLALGEKKGKIISQIVLEVLIVAVVAIALSLFTGNMLSSNISETMLRNDVVAQQEESDMMTDYNSLTWMGYTSNLTADEMIESYDVSLNMTMVLILFGVGIGTILVSTIAPIVYIVRLNPKKIMM